jgi:hypothetical protein
MKTALRLKLRTLCLGAELVAALQASAMTPGLTQIIQCPGSTEIRQVPSINSGNTFGATFWTDGYMVAPMLPRFPAITRCTAKGPFFWVSSAKVVGSIAPWLEVAASEPQAWKDAPAVRDLTGEEFLQAIAQGLGDSPEKLGYLRRRAWWAANQAHRQDSDGQAPTATSDFVQGSAARANLEALAAGLDETNAEELLTKIEALRELARFEEADKLLQSDKLSDERLKPWVLLIGDRVRLRDARVAKLKTER